jgi:hypothetical protein
VHLVDVAGSRLTRAEALFREIGVAKPHLHRGDANELGLDRLGPKGTLGAIAVAFALREMAGTEGAGWVRERLRAWASWLRPGGRIYVIDAGTRRTSRFIQAARDLVADEFEIIAPCCGASGCPLLREERDWCHLTWRLEPGPIARALADRARRRWQDAHFSWLILGTGAAGGGARVMQDPLLHRVLEIRSFGKGKLGALLCGTDGVVSVSALRREAAAAQALEALGPGALVRFDRGFAVPKGDGLRLGPGGLEEVAPL